MQTDEPVTHVGEPGSARQEHWFLRLCARINALCYHWDNYQRLAAAEKAEGDMSRQWLDAEQEAADLRERVRELEGRQGEALPERVRREAAMTPTEQEEYRRTWEETREALKDADFGEELRTIGTREPNQRAKAPDWDNKVRTEVRRRRRATECRSGQREETHVSRWCAAASTPSARVLACGTSRPPASTAIRRRGRLPTSRSSA